MKKIILLFILLISSITKGQDCPNRIGDFIINESTIEDFSKVCSYCSEKYMSKIENKDRFLDVEVSSEDINLEYSGSSSIYELMPDFENLKSWYNIDYASLNDSTRVFFIPNYETDGISIKNLLVKFKKNKLYYMKASLSKTFFDIITEKYKGKGIIGNKKKTKNKCKIVKFQKYLNEHSEIDFLSEIEKVQAKITLDFKINSDCKAETDDSVEIYNYEQYVESLKSRNENLKRLIEEEAINKQNAKEEKLKRF